MRARLVALGLCLVPLACAGESSRVDAGPLTGRVVLRGTLAQAEQGSVRVDVWDDADEVYPLFSRRYALDDPAFERDGAELVLHFELDARHAMDLSGGDPRAPKAIEACFEVSGLLEAALGGDVTARAAAAPGATGIELVLASSAVLYDGDSLGD